MTKNTPKQLVSLVCYLLTVTFVLTSALANLDKINAASQTIYVGGASASETGDGSAEKPFATLEAARDAVRLMPKTEPIEVIVAEGTHYFREKSLTFEEADSGTAENPVVWRGAEGRTILSGATLLDAKLFTPVTDEAIRARLDAGGKDQIFVADLAAAGLSAFDAISDQSAMPLPIPELFFGGKRMTIARWPNEGWGTIKKILYGGTISSDESAPPEANPSQFVSEATKGGVFEYSDESNENRPARWSAAPSVFLHGYWCFDWSSEVIRASIIDPEKKTIALSTPHYYGLRQGNPSPRRWMAVNLLEELDLPGEYYYDCDMNRLYFWPPEKINAANSDAVKITFATADRPVVVFDNASNITFSGFTVTDSYSTGISVVNGEKVEIDRCVIRNTRQNGVSFSNGMNHAITRSLVEETGNGGINASGGNRKTLEPCHFLIENNVIRRFSIHRLCSAYGIVMEGVGLTARRNELYEAPHQAIFMGTNDSVFEYNIVHHVCLASDDCGALYKGRNPSMRGNIVRYNLWYDIGSPRGHGCAAIYFDDGDGGEKVIGNIFVRAGDPGKGSFGTVFSHGGHDILAENNIFIDCKRPLGSAPWGEKSWKDYIDAELWQTRLLKEVDITKPPYTERYPELVGFMNGAPDAARRNRASKNLFIRPTMEASGNWDVDATNWTTDADPGFLNADAGNYSLKSDSEVFQKIPGFAPIPFDQIGPVNQ